MPRALHNEYPGAACHTIIRLGWTISDKDYRRGEYFQELVSVVNSSTSVWQRVAVTNTGGSWSTGNVFVAKTAEAFTYDADGNLTSDGRWTYAWDAENRLINMTSGSSTPTGSKFKMDFAYDWKGRRIEKQVSTNNGSYFGQYTNRYVYDGWNLVAELNSANGLIRGYVWGLDLSGSEQGAGGVGGLLAVNDATNGLHFCGYDGNGNLAVLTKATDGTVSANYEYGPFGEVLRSSGTMARANPFRFSSKYQDDESDQLYYGYRFYNSSSGRWLSRDPISEKGGMNLYGFVYNNALIKIDPKGEAVWWDCVACGAALVGKFGGTMAGCVYGCSEVSSPNYPYGQCLSECLSSRFSPCELWKSFKGNPAEWVGAAACISCGVRAIRDIPKTRPPGCDTCKPPSPPPPSKRVVPCAKAFNLCVARAGGLNGNREMLLLCSASLTACISTTLPVVFPDGQVVLPDGTIYVP